MSDWSVAGGGSAPTYLLNSDSEFSAVPATVTIGSGLDASFFEGNLRIDTRLLVGDSSGAGDIGAHALNFGDGFEVTGGYGTATVNYSGGSGGGLSNTATGDNSLALGPGSGAAAHSSVALGYNTATDAWSSVAIGDSVPNVGSRSVVIGNEASDDAYEAVAIGNGAWTTEPSSVVIGTGSAYHASATAIGDSVQTIADGTVTLGPDAVVFRTPEVGSGSSPVTDSALYPGQMTVEMDESAGAFVLRGKDSTGTVRTAEVSWQ